MGLETLSAYVVAGFLGISILKMMVNSLKRMSNIIINILFGGTLFVILNILGIKLAVNMISILLTSLLGIPGVFLFLVSSLF